MSMRSTFVSGKLIPGAVSVAECDVDVEDGVADVVDLEGVRLLAFDVHVDQGHIL